MIKFGSKNVEAVKKIQKLLNLKIDGSFGSNTETAVREFQKENGLEVDGIVGPNTLKILKKKNGSKNKINTLYRSSDYLEEHDQEDPDIIEDEVECDEDDPVSPFEDELINWVKNQNIIRNIEYIVVHCTGTDTNASVSGIKKYWKNTLGWKNPGYNIIVKPETGYTILADLNNITNGVRGYNSKSIHISTIGGTLGGRIHDTRTEFQKDILETFLKECKRHPKLKNAKIVGHNWFPGVTKACPSYDAQKEYKNI